MEKAELELITLRGLISDKDTCVADIEQQISQAEAEYEKILAIILQIQSAFGEGHDKRYHFENVEHLLPEYFEQMKESGTFGGLAELHALSMRRLCCVKIHEKNGKTDPKPWKIMNPEFETAERPARHLVFGNKHYDSYFPT